jgi:hypothetical protein
MRRVDLSGKRFGRLVVVDLLPDRTRFGNTRWACRCDCGRTAEVVSSHLVTGHTQSCGCIKRKHGHYTEHKGSPTYSSWQAMLYRCDRPQHPHFRHYGGRGISVCPEWRDFRAFLGDVGERPSLGHSLDRIDVDGNYEPGNVRWATAIEQHANRRNNTVLSAAGRTLTLAGWARLTGIKYTTIRERLRRGWAAEDAVGIAALPKHARYAEVRPCP